MNMLYFL